MDLKCVPPAPWIDHFYQSARIRMTREDQFTTALRGTYEAGRARLRCNVLLADARPVRRRLLAKRDTQAGLYKLWELDLLDDSMEAVVLQECYRPLFTEGEISEAKRRFGTLVYSVETAETISS